MSAPGFSRSPRTAVEDRPGKRPGENGRPAGPGIPLPPGTTYAESADLADPADLADLSTTSVALAALFFSPVR